MAEGGSGRYSVKFVGNTSVEGHTVYLVKVTSPDSDTWNIQKRYSDVRGLHDKLRERHGDSLPQIPAKRWFNTQDPAFVQARQAGLQQYLDGVLRLERAGAGACPALLQFLGGPTQKGEQNQERQYKQILEDMQAQLLNLAAPPAPLDDTEVAQRRKKYGQAMKLHVLSQPVDPIHLRAPGFDGEAMQLCSTNAERFEALQKPPQGVGDAPLLSELLDKLHEVLTPTELMADPKKLIVPFPDISLPSVPPGTTS